MICSLSLFSQTTIEPAFIITNHNDTLYGLGSMSSDQKYCSFKKTGVTDFISYHSVCSDYESVNYTKEISNSQSKVELVTGVTRHNFYYSPKVGVLYYHPIKSDRIFIKTGVLYSDRAYWKKEKSTEDYEFNLKIPVVIEFIFSRRNFKPTIGLGWPTGLLAWSGVFPVISLEAGFIYSVTKNWEVSMNGSVDGLYYLTIDEHYLLYNNNLGHSLSFGIIYNLGQNKKSTAGTSVE